jgi:hypothetical protein
VRSYLGDGVFATATGTGEIVLTTENGLTETSMIVLEPEVLQALIGFVALVRASTEPDQDDDLPFVFVPAVTCPTHGKIELTPAQYDEQMNKPDTLWYCPKCNGRAHWDGNEG